MWKRVVAVVISLIVSGVLVWVALRDVEIASVWASIQQANTVGAVVVVVSVLVGIGARAVRWRGLVDDRVSYASSFYIVGLMQFLNILPLRMGEVARTILATREGIPILTTASSIVVERLLDLIFVLGLLAVTIPQVEALPASVAQTTAVFSVAAIVALIVLIVLARYPNLARRILAIIQQRLPVLERLPLESLLDNVLDGLKPLVNPARFVHAVIWTVIAWVFSWLTFYIAQLALGVPAEKLAFPTLSLALAAFSVALPVTVGGVGAFQAAVIVSGEAFGVETVIATAMGFFTHGLTIVAYIITGIWGFLGLGVSFAEVTRQQKPSTSL